MKKIILISLAAAALLCGCAKELPETGVAAQQTPITISSTIAKTSLSGLNVIWNEGDQISVIGSDKVSYPFTVVSGAGTATAEFIGAIPSGVTPAYAIYPRNDKATQTTLDAFYVGNPTNGSKSTADAINGLEFPSVQAPVKNGAEVIPSFGKIVSNSGAYSVEMHNMGILFKITIPEGLNDISEVTISSTNGTSLSGRFGVNIKNENLWTMAYSWDTQVTLANSSRSSIAPGVYYVSSFYCLNNTVYDKNITRNSLESPMLKLKRTDGKVSYTQISNGPASSVRGSVYGIDLTGKSFNWETVESVVVDFSKDLPAGFPTAKASRTKTNTTITVNGHDFVLMADENCKTPKEGWYGWIYTEASDELVSYFAKGSTNVASEAYIKLPEDYNGLKLKEVFFSTRAQSKKIEVVDSLFGTRGWQLAVPYTRDAKPLTEYFKEGFDRIFINQAAENVKKKVNPTDYDYGYYLKMAHSSGFFIDGPLTCIYSKPE